MSNEHNDITVEGWPLLPPGEYLATYQRYDLAFLFKAAKVFVHFQIAESEYQGARIYAAYHVKDIKRKTKRGGSSTLGKTHKLFLQLAELTSSQIRPDRPSLDQLKGCLLRVRVVIVSGPQKRPRPVAAHYSRVDEMLAIEVGRYAPLKK